MVKTTSKTEEKLRWWGYQHIDGGIHVERYFDDADISEAWDSDFVQAITGPFEAESRAMALTHATRTFLCAE